MDGPRFIILNEVNFIEREKYLVILFIYEI